LCNNSLIMNKGEEGGEDKEVVSLQTLSKKMDDFAKARDWEKYHSPRNLLLAMVSRINNLLCLLKKLKWVLVL